VHQPKVLELHREANGSSAIAGEETSMPCPRQWTQAGKGLIEQDVRHMQDGLESCTKERWWEAFSIGFDITRCEVSGLWCHGTRQALRCEKNHP